MITVFFKTPHLCVTSVELWTWIVSFQGFLMILVFAVQYNMKTFYCRSAGIQEAEQ